MVLNSWHAAQMKPSRSSRGAQRPDLLLSRALGPWRVTPLQQQAAELLFLDNLRLCRSCSTVSTVESGRGIQRFASSLSHFEKAWRDDSLHPGQTLARDALGAAMS